MSSKLKCSTSNGVMCLYLEFQCNAIDTKPKVDRILATFIQLNIVE